jgi:hypothetical protein
MTVHNHTSTHPWTAAQEEELRRLARANISARDIAQRLSRTPEAVFERAHELGLMLPRAEATDRAMVRRFPSSVGRSDAQSRDPSIF